MVGTWLEKKIALPSFSFWVHQIAAFTIKSRICFLKIFINSHLWNKHIIEICFNFFKVLLEAKSMCQFESKCENLVTEALEWQLLLSSRQRLKSFRTRPRKSGTTFLVVGSWDLAVNTFYLTINIIFNYMRI